MPRSRTPTRATCPAASRRLVRRETCAAVAAAWDVGPHLILGQGEVMGGGRRNQTILADVCEAILGAIYLDAGYDGRADDRGDPLPPNRAGCGRRAGATQIRPAGMGDGPQPADPDLRVVERTGPDHAPRFRIAVGVEGLAPGLGEGTSKRLAEQAAARAVLEREGISSAAGRRGRRRQR